MKQETADRRQETAGIGDLAVEAASYVQQCLGVCKVSLFQARVQKGPHLWISVFSITGFGVITQWFTGRVADLDRQ
jgi:hypothetical protein